MEFLFKIEDMYHPNERRHNIVEWWFEVKIQSRLKNISNCKGKSLGDFVV